MAQSLRNPLNRLDKLSIVGYHTVFDPVDGTSRLPLGYSEPETIQAHNQIVAVLANHP